MLGDIDGVSTISESEWCLEIEAYTGDTDGVSTISESQWCLEIEAYTGGHRWRVYDQRV